MVSEVLKKGDDAMQADTLTKRTIVKSILFVIGFWSFVGALMYGMIRLLDAVDVTAIATQVLGG